MTRAEAPARTGLLGGTFNPIHVAHLRAAEDVAEALGLERIVFIPSAVPPHKPPISGDVIAPATHRLAWVRLAITGNPRFAADDLELTREGPSYSIHTLRAYTDRLSPALPVFLIGEDALRELDTWREPEELLGLAHFAVMTRPPGPLLPLESILPAALARAFEFAPDGDHARHRAASSWMRRVHVTALDVSASDLRARLRSGRSVRYLIPEMVREAVQQSGVYSVPEAR